MPAPAFANYDLAFATEFLRGRALVTAAKATMNDVANAVEIQRFDLVAAGGALGGTRGGFIRRLIATPRATIAATRLFILSTIDGASYDLRGYAALAAFDSTLATPVVPADFGATETTPWRMAGGERFYACSPVALAGGIVFEAEGDGFA